MPRSALILLLAATLASAQAPETPKSYSCYRTPHPIRIDGKLDDPAWRRAPWTTDFVDIRGNAGPTPRFRTRAKLLWDDTTLYIAAQLQEPDVKATITQHDAVIFHDNDFEVFLKPPAEITAPDGSKQPAPGYFEFEINALNTSWDLYLDKPYRLGGHPDNSWNIPGLKTAVAIHGTLNNPSDTDRGWTVEIAIPFAAFATRLPVAPPHPGDQWRINFSRVEWPKGIDGHDPANNKPGIHTEDNWVWTPQGEINMHIPEHWGYLNFRNKP